jgi:hypothetical protein
MNAPGAMAPASSTACRGTIWTMDSAAAQEFAASWVQGWNAHELERVLSHFALD